MSVFAVTFRIHDDSDYRRRYDSFTDEVRNGATTHWEETTSFMLVETTESIDSFCSRIYVKSSFDSSKDIYVVMDTQVKSARARGPIKYPFTLHSLLPYLKTL